MGPAHWRRLHYPGRTVLAPRLLQFGYEEACPGLRYLIRLPGELSDQVLIAKLLLTAATEWVAGSARLVHGEIRSRGPIPRRIGRASSVAVPVSRPSGLGPGSLLTVLMVIVATPNAGPARGGHAGRSQTQTNGPFIEIYGLCHRSIR